MIMKAIKVRFTDRFSGRSISFRTTKNVDMENDIYGWMSNRQRKKLEDFFGKMAAYYTVMEIEK